MFGIAEKSEDALRDTATIACARAAMERIDRDEKEPDAGFKQRAPKRAAPGAALEKPDDTAAAPAGAEEPAAASAAPAPAPVMRESPRASPEASPRRAAYGASPAGASPAPRLGTAPPSPSEALDLFGSFGKDTHGDYNDSFLSLDAGDDDDDEGRGSASRLDVDLDVAFETMEVAHRGILGAVDLTGHTPRSLDDKFDLGSPSPYGAASYHASPRRDAPKGDRGGFPRASPDRFGDGARPFGRSFDAPRFHDGSETSTSHHGGDDLFHGAPYHGRTGLTPCGPMLKTPAGMLHGLSPLHNTRSGSRTPLFSVREATDALESMESHRGRGAVYIAAASCGLVFGGVDARGRATRKPKTRKPAQ
ncbi:hypothetical protein M885DRAFT_544896 [Pelagophyceae sp. CCMP2097]|nr:hypothetical protein M885DRAFT_544896 [Pelagophyceae sp. CCMP2097]